MKKNIKFIFALSLAALLTGCNAKTGSLIACNYYTVQGRCKSVIKDVQEYLYDYSQILNLNHVTVNTYLFREAIAKDGTPIMKENFAISATLDLDQFAIKFFATETVLPEGGKEETNVLYDEYYFLDPSKGAILVENDCGTYWELQKTASELEAAATAAGVDITTYMKHKIQAEFLEEAYNYSYSILYGMSTKDETEFFKDMATDFVEGSIAYSINAKDLEIKGSNKNNNYSFENSEGTYKGTNEYDFYCYLNGFIPKDTHVNVTFKGDSHEISTGKDYIGVTNSQKISIETKKSGKIALPNLDKIPFVEGD